MNMPNDKFPMPQGLGVNASTEMVESFLNDRLTETQFLRFNKADVKADFDTIKFWAETKDFSMVEYMDDSETPMIALFKPQKSLADMVMELNKGREASQPQIKPVSVIIFSKRDATPISDALNIKQIVINNQNVKFMEGSVVSRESNLSELRVEEILP